MALLVDGDGVGNAKEPSLCLSTVGIIDQRARSFADVLEHLLLPQDAPLSPRCTTLGRQVDRVSLDPLVEIVKGGSVTGEAHGGGEEEALGLACGLEQAVEDAVAWGALLVVLDTRNA